MKGWRQTQILQLVDQEAISSQDLLRQKLQARGIEATQATLSRDLKELGLVKRAGDGAYTRPGNERGSEAVREQLRRAMATLVRGLQRVEFLIVIHTDPGQAQALGSPLDRSQLAELAGTVAGDDTILLVCHDLTAAKQLEARLNEMVRGR
jgi:transcriptional regulator of arginine metabolism